MARKPTTQAATKKPSTRAKRVEAREYGQRVEIATSIAIARGRSRRSKRFGIGPTRIFRRGVNQSDPVADWFQAEERAPG